MRTPTPTMDPWASDVDNGWRDLVVSSAPPPGSPPPPPPAAMDPANNRTLPADLTTWQEHGAPRSATFQGLTVEEPNFGAGDRRLWIAAGTLMALAVLVLALLGVLTFGGVWTSRPPVAEPARAPEPAAAAEPARVAEVPRPSAVVTTTRVATDNARPAKRSKHEHGHHHKSVAER